MSGNPCYAGSEKAHQVCRRGVIPSRCLLHHARKQFVNLYLMSGQISPRFGNNFPIAKRPLGAAEGFVAFLHCTFTTAVCDHNARARLACRTIHSLCKFRRDSGRDFIRQRQQGGVLHIVFCIPVGTGGRPAAIAVSVHGRLNCASVTVCGR